MIYLATPYNHPDPEVREGRFRAACTIAGYFLSHGVYVFSPIAHSHSIALARDLPHDWEFWRQYDRQMLSMCSELWVVEMDGWGESVGVAAEIEIARELGLPVKFVRYQNCPVPDLVVVEEEEEERERASHA